MTEKPFAELSATEQRAKLLEMSTELIKVMREITGPVNKISCALVGEADTIHIKALDEHATIPRRKKVVYKDPRKVEPLLPQRLVGPPKMGPGKRACSICRRPGHRATTCPDKVKGNE